MTDRQITPLDPSMIILAYYFHVRRHSITLKTCCG